MTGRIVSHYRIVRKLGSGGMGVVYQAEDTRLQRSVALKFLPEEVSDRPDVLSRFGREARAASSLNHPNICTIHDVGDFEGRPYLVMELMEGQTLRERLQQGPLDPREALEFASQLAGALDAAHTHGIVHRDIKPGNIFLTSLGQAKILDFGLAKTLGAGGPDGQTLTELTQVGTFLGTVAYMSPEQALAKPLDHRTDLFSLGVVLYEMLSGKHPFRRDTLTSTIDSIIHDRPEPFAQSRVRVSTHMESVVSRLLEKAPERRYQSARELASDLQHLSLQGPSALPPSLLRTGRRKRRLLAAAGVAALALLIGLSFGNWAESLWVELTSPQTSPSERSSRPIVAVTPLVNVSDEPSLDQVGVGIAHTLITSLSGIRSLTMISPSASLGYEGADPGEIARKLGATFVVAGSVQKSGNRLRVTLNLIQGDSVIWGGGSEGSPDDLFELQRQLASDLSRGLRLVLTEQDVERLKTRPTSNNEAYADYMQARAFLERSRIKDNLARAITLFEAAIQKDPNFSLAYAGLGEAYWKNYDQMKETSWTVKASEAIGDALKIDPDQPGVRYSLAVIYHGTGRYAKAEEELRRVLDFQPNSDDAHRLLGETQAAQGKTQEALREFRQAINLRPNYWENHKALGLAYYDDGRYMEAVAAFRRLTELQPDLPAGFQLLGASYHQLGYVDDAIANYKKALEIGPSPSAYSNLGTLYYRRRQFAEAAQNYEKALEVRPLSSQTHRNLGDTYQRLGRPEDAKASYIQALELTRDQLRVNPSDGKLLAMQALLEAKLERPVEAARHAAQAVEAAPTDGQVLYKKAVVHALAGESEEAIRTLKTALDHGFSSTEARQDDDLASLQQLSEFQEIVKGRN